MKELEYKGKVSIWQSSNEIIEIMHEWSLGSAEKLAWIMPIVEVGIEAIEAIHSELHEHEKATGTVDDRRIPQDTVTLLGCAATIAVHGEASLLADSWARILDESESLDDLLEDVGKSLAPDWMAEMAVEALASSEYVKLCSPSRTRLLKQLSDDYANATSNKEGAVH